MNKTLLDLGSLIWNSSASVWHEELEGSADTVILRL